MLVKKHISMRKVNNLLHVSREVGHKVLQEA